MNNNDVKACEQTILNNSNQDRSLDENRNLRPILMNRFDNGESSKQV